MYGAAYCGRTSVVDALLKGGAKPDLQNKNGYTAPMDTAFKGHASIVNALLKAGARTDLKAKDGKTAPDVEVAAKRTSEGAAGLTEFMNLSPSRTNDIEMASA